ncbi:NAD(P)-dependent oxidoreductase [Streptococcus oricebi]|uniref:NADH-flavin reductase n=1 Tax=Streptococcus oricebi TaxID=1547447 RepID=A0ABS5B238_9STRE|nr:NAD(P)-dependent oxidoreductase [Streptococcus oricebi]MBP2622906.1 NADH-flavin reductase [Streptococcus oricebi]
MKIAVVAANGLAGQAIVAEALARGHEVTALVRSKNKSQAQKVLEKDLFDLTREDLTGFDVVVTAFGAFSPELLPQHTTSLEHLAGLLEGTDTRFLVVGGAGSLYLDESLTSQLSDAPDFPAEFKPLAKAMAQGLEALRRFNQVKWTYISPAADFVEDGEKTGDYILAGEVFTLNEAGQSSISYADYAIAMLDEIEQGQHIQERISVLGK